MECLDRGGLPGRLVLVDQVGFSPLLVFLEGGLAGFVFREAGVNPAVEHIALRAEDVEAVILKRLPAEFHTDRQGVVARAGFDPDLRLVLQIETDDWFQARLVLEEFFLKKRKPIILGDAGPGNYRHCLSLLVGH